MRTYTWAILWVTASGYDFHGPYFLAILIGLRELCRTVGQSPVGRGTYI